MSLELPPWISLGEMLDGLSAALAIFDAKGVLLWKNAHADSLLRLPERNIGPGRGIGDLGWGRIDVDGVALPVNEWPLQRAIHSGEVVHTEYGMVPPGEAPIFLDTRITPLRDKTGEIVGFAASFVDITDRVIHKHRLDSTLRRFENLITHAPVGVAELSADGTVLSANAPLAHMFGVESADGLLGRSLGALLGVASRRTFELTLEATIGQPGAAHSAELLLSERAGQFRWGVAHFSFVRPEPLVESGTVLMYLADTTHRRASEDRLRFLADHDPLTGLLNRRGFARLIQRHANTVREGEPGGCVLVLDIDNFKAINDTFGHTTGDAVIVRIASQLVRILTMHRPDAAVEGEHVARLGGDEFAVLIDGATSAESSLIADAMREAVKAASLIDGVDREVTISVGVASLDSLPIDRPDPLAGADLAMYRAKNDGKDRVEIAARLPENHLQPRQWLAEVQDALAADRFVLCTQPVFDLATMEITQHEVLLRLVGPAGDHVSPSRWLPVVENQRLGSQVDAWVVRQVLGLLRTGPESFEVNLSVGSLTDPLFLDEVRDWAAEPGVDPSRLVLEVSETALVANFDCARQFAQKIRNIGCRFALDDFGAGLGGFYYLKYLPFDLLKIDGEYVRSCASNPADRAIIRALVEVSAGLGGATVAEQVERAEAVPVLQDLGVTLGQGYYLARPQLRVALGGAAMDLEQPTRTHAHKARA